MKTSTEYNVLQEYGHPPASFLSMVAQGYSTLPEAKKAMLELEEEGKSRLVIQKVERTQYDRSDLGLE
jgi:hypothetical protein